MKQLRGFKYRIKVNDSQRLQLAQTFGSVRFVFNWALNLRSASYKEKGQSISYNQTSKLLTALKKQEETAWLKDISSVPLQQGLKHLDRAFKNFFKQQNKIKKLPLSVREWECNGCGKLNPRDKNAALNILGAGLALLARGVSNDGELPINLGNSSYDTTKRESLSEGVSFRASFNFDETRA